MGGSVLRGAVVGMAMVWGVVLASRVSAQPAEDYARQGFYLGAAGTYALEDFDFQTVHVDDSWGLNLRSGYRANPWIAAEVEYEYLSQFDLHRGSSDWKVDGWAFTVNGRAIAPLGRVQPYVIGGLGVLSAKVSGAGHSQENAGFAIRLGAGADIYLTRNLLGVLEGTYVVPTGKVDDFEYGSISWGVQYRF